MKFRYQKFPREPNPAFPTTKWVSRPVILVELVNREGNPFQYQVLVDSGADHNMFHSEIGEELSLDIESGKPLEFFGITGDKQKAFFHQTEIKVGGNPYKIYCGFAPEFKTPYGILGQDDFFKIFSIKFDLPRKLIELREA